MAVILTQHAVDRYWERVRPGLDVQQARDELQRLVDGAVVERGDPPAWAGGLEDQTDGWIVVSDGILVVVDTHFRKMYAKTCLVRGSVGPGVRERRNRRKALRRHGARLKHRAQRGRPELDEA